MALRLILLLVFLFPLGMRMRAQSQAALDKLAQHYPPAQVEEMSIRTHYKYEGLLLFYSSSFRVWDSGEYRAANEIEIANVDLDHYAALRQENTSVTVHDLTLGRDLLLLSRNEFEHLMLEQLNEADRAAYLAYKATSSGQQGKER